jgi:acyl-CoA synthetase (AMP-forming)/AMP-acid ligase II
VRIRRADGSDADTGELGEIYVSSPFRMHGYAQASGSPDGSAEDRLVDGYLRTGDIGRLDEQAFSGYRAGSAPNRTTADLSAYPDLW